MVSFRGEKSPIVVLERELSFESARLKQETTSSVLQSEGPKFSGSIMPSRPIPEEIISMILAYLMDSPAKQTHDPTKTTSKRVAIVQYACVSSIWRAEVERLLYEELSLSSPLEIVLCFRIIAYGRRGMTLIELSHHVVPFLTQLS